MLVDYQVHLPKYLAECINLDKPQLQCNGQCVLMKKIQEKEQEDTKKNMLVYEYSAYYMHNNYTSLEPLKPREEVDNAGFSPYLLGYSFNYHASIFHPPIA